MNGATVGEHKVADVNTNAKDPSVFSYVKPSPPPLPAASTPPPPVLVARQPSTDPVSSTSPYRTMTEDLGIGSFSELFYTIKSIEVSYSVLNIS